MTFSQLKLVTIEISLIQNFFLQDWRKITSYCNTGKGY